MDRAKEKEIPEQGKRRHKTATTRGDVEKGREDSKESQQIRQGQV